jgi:hypothetical protein
MELHIGRKEGNLMNTCPKDILRVADKFMFPGPRYKHLGSSSGEAFRELLTKKLLETDALLQIDLDGAAGYGSSFLEEAFGGLIREGKVSLSKVQSIVFKSEDEPYLLDEIKSYIEDEIKRKP